MAGGVPVHLGHLAIHQHDIEGGTLDRAEGLGAVADGFDVAAELLELVDGNLLVDEVVLGLLPLN